MNEPQNFRPGPGAFRPPPAPARVVHLPAPPPALLLPPARLLAPVLTLYRDGLVCGNGAAARLLTAVAAVLLYAPAVPGAPWLLAPVPAAHPGALPVYRAAHDARPRFRAYALATHAFALLPDGQKSLAFDAVPDGDFFRLRVAWGSVPK